MRYYDREWELESLKTMRKKSFDEFSRMTVLKGRRRIGKTTLGMMSVDGSDSVYLFVSRKSEAELCGEYADIIRQSLQEYVPDGISRIKDIFEILLNIGKHRSFSVFMDEFQEFLYVNPSIYADIQNVWDRERRNSNVNFLVSGSVYSLMEKLFKNEKQPLYGRADLTLTLEPFRTDVLKEILADHKKRYTNDDLLALYCFTGGVPKYVELLMDNGCTDMASMVEYMTRPDSQFFDEGRNMLILEFGKQYGTYFSILGSIAGGDVTLPQIEGLLGEKSLGGQMKLLEEDYALIRKKRPLRSKESSKNVRFEICDVFLRFWFRYFHKYRSWIEIKNYSALAARIRDEYESYSGRVLERWFRQKMMESQSFIEIGGWWHPRKNAVDPLAESEVDIVTVTPEGKVSAYEVKRNRKKYSPEALGTKVTDMQNGAFQGLEIECGCLAIEDM